MISFGSATLTGVKRIVVLLLAVAVLATLVVMACSSDPDGGVTQNDASSPGDAGDGGDAGPIVSCTQVDLPTSTKKWCDTPSDAGDAGISVPAEFCIREYTTLPVHEARVMRFAPNGDLFVAAPSFTTVGAARDGTGSIVVLPDDDGDGRADTVLTYAGNLADAGPGDAGSNCSDTEGDPGSLACVHGLAFAGDHLYFTRSDEVRRYPYKSGDRAAPTGPGELVATLGTKEIPDGRWTHTVEATKDGQLLVSRGRFDTNDCSTEQLTRGAVFSLPIAKGTFPLAPELVANGFRNPMYLRCSPASCGDCYASELSGDNWDGVGGHEKLSLLAPGQKWGYPCCVSKDRQYTVGADCTKVPADNVAIPLHDTNFGLDFERGSFPAQYRHAIFVALHGAFTSFGGSAVVWLPVDPTSLRPSAAPKLFADGFAPAGRATDVAFSPDGRLFVADDSTGKIYWIAAR